MTLPYPAATDPLADTPVYIENLRAAARTAMAQINFVTFGPVGINTNVNGDFTFNVPGGLTTVQGIIFQHNGTATITIVLRGLVGASAQGQVWIAQTGSNAWANSAWQGSNLQVYGFAWGVK